jgi:hypothetical protein
VDVVIYNSWRLDFGLALQSFDPFLRVERDLADLSTERERNMCIVFISSLSSVKALATRETAPEAPVTGYPGRHGHGVRAVEAGGGADPRGGKTEVSCARVRRPGRPGWRPGAARPQAAVSSCAWAEQPWISAVVRTSEALGCFPSPVAPIDWVPVDTVAAMLHRVALEPAAQEP